MAVKWIITDVDGCLSPEESIPWDLDLFWQFAQLSREASAGKAAIAPMTLCTGRPQPYVECLMKILDIRASAICENGAVLYSLHDNHAHYAEGMTDEKIAGLRRLRQHVEDELLPRFPGAVIQFGKEAQMSIFCQNPGIFPTLHEEIQLFISDKHLPALDINTSHFYLNLSLQGVNKGNAIRQLLRELKVDHDHTAGIGDTAGDLPLREAVGFFACPANATAEVKKVADYVSPYPMLQGVLDILQRPQMRRE